VEDSVQSTFGLREMEDQGRTRAAATVTLTAFILCRWVVRQSMVHVRGTWRSVRQRWRPRTAAEKTIANAK